MVEKRILALVALLALLSGQMTQVAGQSAVPKKFALTIDNIMRGPELYGYEPANVRWSGDGARLYFSWRQASDPLNRPMDTYQVNRDGSGLKKLGDDEVKLLPPAFGGRSRDRKRTVYTSEGDLFLWDFSTDKRRQLTKTTDVESNPQFTLDEKRITFSRGGNLYLMSLETGFIEQLTDIRAAAAPGGEAVPPVIGGGGGRGGQGQGRGGQGRGGAPPIAPPTGRGGATGAEDKGTESQEFLKKQERDLLEVIADRAKLREENDAKRKATEAQARKPFTLQARQTAGRLELCPDESCVIASVNEAGTGSKPDNVPNYITESSYTEVINGRTNVGDTQGRQRLAILNVKSGEVKWVDPSLNNPGLKDREVQLQAPLWNEQGTHAVISARAADNKDRWILALDPTTGSTRILFTEHDDAWIGGPGALTLGWLKNGEDVYFQSERDGYSHLYKVAFGGGEPKQLTSGKFEVSSVELSQDGSKFYLTSSEVGPGERHFYSMSTDGGARTQITKEAGNHRVTLSPDEKWMADVFSYTNRPPELFVAANQPGAAAKKLTDSPAKEFWDYKWQDVPIVQVTARDGMKIPARFFKPANYRRGGPAVIFVHGAGYLQNVHKYWSSYSREYMFHHFLVERGYMVLDMDYRASSGYGRDWRTAIYRHMGGKDLDDNLDGAKWLIEQGADPKRIGLYGGSYGGFITLMALFTSPDTFAAGAALRPVTDWAHYNHGYTANILNIPQKDIEAYKKSSPIYFASGLKGALLICHGMVDTNVFFQDSVRLIQKLIELRKENWSVAPYPVEDHGFLQPSSWADEYKRIFKLFEDNLKNKS